MKKLIIGVILFAVSISSTFATSDIDQKTIDSNNRVIQMLEKRITFLKSQNERLSKKQSSVAKSSEEKHYFNGVLINEYKGRWIINLDWSCVYSPWVVHYRSIDYISIYKHEVLAVDPVKCTTRSSAIQVR